MRIKQIVLFAGLNIIFLSLYAQLVLKPEVDSIPMRDGKKLAADIYLPDTLNQYPVILVQTPYNRLFYRLGLPLIGKKIKTSRYAFVIVDWRCFYGSKNACKLLPDRGKDGYDVIDWISKQAWSNGKVGTWGPSALGKVQYLTAKEQHPAHVCAVPVVAAPQFTYNEYYPGGVYRTEYVEQLDALGYGMSTILKAHPYYDAWWKIAEAVSWYPEKIKIPMLLIGGWFDHNIGEMFNFFDTLVKASGPSVRNQHKMLVGPWSHNTVGKKQVGELEFPETEGLSDSFAMLFFDYYLLGAKNGWPLNKRYIISAIKLNSYTNVLINQMEDWPRYKKERTIFLTSDKSMILDSLFHSGVGNDNVSFSFKYDPRSPSETIGGPTLRTDLKQGPQNIEELLGTNEDKVVFRKYPNPGMFFEGPGRVELYVSSNRLDTDFGIRIYCYTEENPPQPIIFMDGIARTRFRNGYSVNDTQMMHPDSVYKIIIDLPPMGCECNIMDLMITSSNYPRFDLNLNNGKELYTAGDTLVATNKIYVGEKYPSKIVFYGDITWEGTGQANKAFNIMLYPNPAGNELFFRIPGSFKNQWQVEIRDITGKIMKSKEIRDNRISIMELKPGMYIIRFVQDEKVAVRRFVKM